MLVTCPSCQSAYRFSDEAIGAGRMVRCARCATQWFAAPPPEPIMALDDATAVEIVEEGAPPAKPDKPAPPPKRRKPPRARKPAGEKNPYTRTNLALSGAGIAILCLLFVQRVEVVRLAPSLASIYRAVGLDVNTRGLAIREVKSSEQLEEGSPLLFVSGAIANVTGDSVAVPRLRLAVMASDDRELYAWTTVAARAQLGPGETAQFKARLASPPADGQRVEVRFLSRRDIMTRSSY